MRILFVAIGTSIHAARWINQLSDTGWEIHFFDSADKKICSELTGVTLYRGWYAEAPSSIDIHYRWPFRRGNWLLPRIPFLSRLIVPEASARLKKVIEKIQPDVIHAMSMTHSVFLLAETLNKLKGIDIPWLYSSWGSDFYYFGQQPDIAEKIRMILPTCKYYISNNQRDVRLARAFGFHGEAMGIFPGPGGYPIKKMRALREPGLTSDRRIIAVKGFHNWAGRALAAMDAIELCAKALQGYEIVVFSPHPPVRLKIAQMLESTNLSITILAGRHNPQKAIWELLGKSRIYLGVSMTDGIPNTMLEAMVMGAFPIQTNPGCVTEEWVDNGVNGLLIPYDDPDQIADAIMKAVDDDVLVDQADSINDSLTRQRIDISVIQPKVVSIYERIVTESSSTIG